MERGTDEELAAVTREWQTLERERRLTTRLLVGVSLVFVGAVAMLVFAGLPLEVCIYSYGLQPDACTTGTLGIVGQTLLFGLGAGALGAGAWLSWRSVRKLRGNGRHV